MESRLDGVNYLLELSDDDEHLKLLTERTLKRVFHLATVAGVQSANLQIGKRVNLTATLALLDHLSEQRRPTRLVYSSSVGVFGKPMPKIVDDETLPDPQWSCGAHKLACEILITDYARLGLVDGIVLRFPGIVARPEGSTTMLSAFINNVFYAAHSGRPFKLPLAPEDGTWLMSLRRCLDNVLHAAAIPSNQLSTHRVFTLPALFVTMTELVDALAEVYGASLRKIITYEPTDAARQLFAWLPLGQIVHLQWASKATNHRVISCKTLF